MNRTGDEHDGLAELADDGKLEDPRLLEATRAYQADLDAGRRPDRAALLARYPDLAEELAECFDGLDFVHEAAPQLSRGDAGRTTPHTPGEVLQPEGPLGDFRLVREIGRGGMGVVYEAVQISLGRRVALKVLPFAATIDDRQLQRFKNEAHAAAQLHHNHIVPVFFVGSERGVHFYAMQYIEGQTLAALIADLRRAEEARAEAPAGAAQTPSAPRSATALAAATQASKQGTAGRAFFALAAQLGVQAAEALEHAHQMGVVHRDIKPANLLLDARNQVWVTDFGLARFQTDAGLTASGDVIGTLRYMSPEQAGGKPIVDHRTDVYSLGATLYELLALRPAFDGRTRQEFMHLILETEPAALQAHNRAVPADLETIVLKAMAKLPEERYATAQEMADDLRRFLDDRPIRARRPTLLEKAAKWSRRHRALVGAGVALLMLAVLGLSASTLLIWNEQSKTAAVNKRLGEQVAETEAANDRLTRQYERNQEDFRRVLEIITQASEEDMADRPDPQAFRRKLLEAALAYFKEFIEQHRDDPAITEELAESSLRVAVLLDKLGERAEAVAMAEQARRFQEMQPPPARPGNPGGPGRFPQAPLTGPGIFSPALLLTQKSVQDELKLSPDQIEQISALKKKRDEAWAKTRWSEHPDRKRFEDLAAKEKALTEVLNPEQARRLRQLIWQQRGTHALSDPEVADALALSGAQRAGIRKIAEEAATKFFARSFDRHRREGGKPEDYWRNVSEQTLRVLTQEQRAKWTDMQGEPFKGVVHFGPPLGSGSPSRPH